MGMKNSHALMTIMGIGMALSNQGGFYNDSRTVKKPLTKEQIKKREQVIKNKRRENYGLTEYFYGENIIYARNQKNADRKARNKGYL